MKNIPIVVCESEFVGDVMLAALHPACGARSAMNQGVTERVTNLGCWVLLNLRMMRSAVTVLAATYPLAHSLQPIVTVDLWTFCGIANPF